MTNGYRSMSKKDQFTEITAVGIPRADHPFYSQKLAVTSPTIGSRSVSIVCSRTKAMELLLVGVITIWGGVF
jgi:hypothetical protein